MVRNFSISNPPEPAVGARWHRPAAAIVAAVLSGGGIAAAPAGGGAAAPAIDAAIDVKAPLIDRLLHPRPSPWMPNAVRMLSMLAEPAARRLFLSLGSGTAWGPAQRQWRERFPAFHKEYLQLVVPPAAELEKLLAERLRQELSDDDLAELVAIQADPRLEPLLQTASRLGFDLEIAMRTTQLAGEPELYGPEEIEQVRGELEKLRGKGLETEVLMAKMQAVSRRYQAPAFARYQRLMMDTLLPLANATRADAAFQARLAAWTTLWRERLRQP